MSELTKYNVGDRVEVRHVYNPLAHKRYTSLPDTITWHKGTITGIQDKHAQVKLDVPFKGWHEPVVSMATLRRAEDANANRS